MLPSDCHHIMLRFEKVFKSKFEKIFDSSLFLRLEMIVKHGYIFNKHKTNGGHSYQGCIFIEYDPLPAYVAWEKKHLFRELERLRQIRFHLSYK